jgi:hypothetical protein
MGRLCGAQASQVGFTLCGAIIGWQGVPSPGGVAARGRIGCIASAMAKSSPSLVNPLGPTFDSI